jgi:hypothetical protein
MYFPLAYKQALWIEHIGEHFKTQCSKCKKDLTAFEFDILEIKNKTPIFIHLKC